MQMSWPFLGSTLYSNQIYYHLLISPLIYNVIYIAAQAWLSEWLRRWSNKPDVVGSIPVTTEFFVCDSNQVPKWFRICRSHYNISKIVL